MRAQRALKEGVVIRKRQREPWFPSSCVPAAHSRECIGMNWHTRRAEVVAPYDTCVQRHRILGARNARPYEMQTADGSPGSEIPCL